MRPAQLQLSILNGTFFWQAGSESVASADGVSSQDCRMSTEQEPLWKVAVPPVAFAATQTRPLLAQT